MRRAAAKQQETHNGSVAADMPSLRTVMISLFALLLLAAGAFALAREKAGRELLGIHASCPPGYRTPEQVEAQERRERAAQGGAEEQEKEVEGVCRSARNPEPIGELLRMQTESGRRARGGQPAPRTGAYAAAVHTKEQIARTSGTL